MDMQYSMTSPEKPVDWPANAKESMLDCILTATEDFIAKPNYITKERLLSHVSDYELNQRSFIGLYRVTEFEVGIINALYLYASQIFFPALKVYTYEIVAESTRLQKNVAYVSESMGENVDIAINAYEEGLALPLKLMYWSYQRYTVEKNKSFSEHIIDIVNEICSQGEDAISEVTRAYISMLNDISYMHGNMKFDLWKFSRIELSSLFALEASLIALSKQVPTERPLKGVLMTQISNYILKSRNGYNNGYICKYISANVARSSIINKEIWMNKTENLNDEREQKVIPELLSESNWISFEWAKGMSIKPTRLYYVSSFSKSLSGENMGEYGECVYGFKGDRLVELLSPILVDKYESQDTNTSSNPKIKKVPRLSQVLAFDILYDKEEAQEELLFLMQIIDLFQISDSDKRSFFSDILQYWILSVKDNKWAHEQERRYVLFLYPKYEYIEMTIEDSFLKLKTSAFLLPDFILGPNPVKDELIKYIDNKRKVVSQKDYAYCHHCLNRDYDFILGHEKCSVCGSSDIEICLVAPRVE